VSVDTSGGPTVRAQLTALTGGKVVTNTALRWVGPFLPTLERAFGTSTGTLTGIMGVAELGGLTTLATGSHLDRGRERTVFLAGIALVGLSSIIALGGTTWTFAIAYAVIVIGITNHTIAGHAWIGHRVAFAQRNRAIGTYETSWALALLVGAPVLALLIELFGWRGPYVALAIASATAFVVVGRRVAPSPLRHAARPEPEQPRVALPATAWPPMLASAATAMAGIGVFVISGAWLDDDYGVSTGGLGLIAAGFGAVELVSSVAVAAFADRIGARRSVLAGLLLLLVGAAIMASADSRLVAVLGLAGFLMGFEYALIASLTLVTEAAPAARGRAIGVSNALGTVARSVGVILSGQLYEAYGIEGSLSMATVASVAAFALIVLSSVQHRRTAPAAPVA
jgi:predicted MFS family arabinose efflux permease